MAFRVKTSAEAKKDARKILGWLRSQHAGDTGLRWFRGLEEAITSLAEMPERCPLAPESASLAFDMRQLLYGRNPHVYRILFAIDRDVVYVIHIRHGRRKYLTEI